MKPATKDSSAAATTTAVAASTVGSSRILNTAKGSLVSIHNSDIQNEKGH